MTPAEKKAWLAGTPPAPAPEPVPAAPAPAPKPPVDTRTVDTVAPTAKAPVKTAPKPAPKPAVAKPAIAKPPVLTPEQEANVSAQLAAMPRITPDPDVKPFEAPKSASIEQIIEEAPGTIKRLGTLLVPSLASGVKNLPGLPAKLLGPEVEKAAEEWAGTAREEVKQEDVAKAAEAETKAEEAKKSLIVPEPALVLARSLDGITDEKDPNKQFLDARSQQILNDSLRVAGGPDAVTDGPTYNRMVRDARRQAVEELTKLYIRRQWTHSVGPDDLSSEPGPSWLESLAPKREFTIGPDGGVQELYTESVPGWFFNVPLSILDYAATAAAQSADMDEERDFSQRFLENVRDRKDLLTFRIEADQEMQADLASGDTERVTKALLTLSPWLGLTVLTPSPVEVGTLGSSAARVVRNAPQLMDELKKAGSASAAAGIINNAAQRSKEIVQETVTAVREGQATDKVLAFADEYRVDSNLERAAKNSDPDVAEMARNDLAAAMQADPEVAEYLRVLNRGDVPDPRDAPKVPFGPDEQARQTEIADRIAALSAERRAAPDKAAIDPIDAELSTLRAERDTLEKLQVAKRGEERFSQVYKETADKVVSDLEDMALGVSRPERRASFYAPRPDPVQPSVDEDLIASVGSTQAALIEKIAKATSSEELLRVLSRADELDREAIANKLGYASYGELKTKASTVQTASIDKAQAAADAAKAELAKYQDAVDNGDTSPETDALFEQANAAQDALDAAKINAKTRAKRQAQVDRMFEAARASESADFDKAEAALSAAQKKYASADKALQARLSAVTAAAPRNAEVMQRLETARGDLDAAAKQLRAASEYERAARKAARSEPPTDPVVLLAGDRRTLMEDLSVYNRNRRKATQKWHHTIVSKVYDFFRDNVWNAWREVEEASLTDAARRVRRVLDGETAEVGERLTRAFASGAEDAPNPAALVAVSDEVEAFRAAVLDRSLPSEFFALVAGAYVKADVVLEPGRAKELAQAVADWAASDGPIQALRDTVVKLTSDVTAGNPDLVVPPGLGDTFFAMGVGYGGATRKAMLAESTVFVDPDTARDINAIFHQPYVGMGGNPRASRGTRALAGGVVDPFAYVPPEPGTAVGRVWTSGVPLEAQQPYVPAFGRSGIPKGSVGESAAKIGEYEDFSGAAELEKGLSEATTAESVAAVIRPHLSPAEQAVLARIMEVLPERPWDIKVVQITDKFNDLGIPLLHARRITEAVGLTYVDVGKSYKMFLRGGSFSGFGTGMHPRVVLHEMLHMATVERLHALEKQADSALLRDFKDVYEAARRAIPSGDLQAMYRINNLSEMVAYGLSDVDFQKVLKNTPSQGKTLWSRFVSAVSRMLGLENQENLLSDLMSLTDKLLDEKLPANVVPGAVSAAVSSPSADADALAELMDTANNMFTREVYVPRAVRDNFLKYAEAAIATRRLGGRMTKMEGAVGFWKQAAILGIGLSNPGQGWLDHMGDLWQASTRSPWLAAKTAWRSTPSQLLHTKGAAQVTRLVDFFLKKPAGETAKALDVKLSRLTMSPDIDRILNASDEVVGNTGMTGRELLKLYRREGVLENFYASQVTRTVAAFGTVALPKWARTTAGAVQGGGAGAILGGPLGGLVGAISGAIFGRSGAAEALLEANRDSLMFLANTAANRRRAAIVYGLIEEGMAPEKACREGVRIFGDFSGELSPWLRSTVGVVYPFLSFRKFSVRRTLKALANPFWMKGMANIAEHGGDALSAYANAIFSSEDEYGFHTGDMAIEPDPVELNKLLARIHNQNPGMPLDEVWRVAEEEINALPRAIERYNAIKARLDAMPYLEAKRAILAGSKTVEDGTEEVAEEVNGEPKDGGLVAMMGPYWAPDPVKHMLPLWAQDRAAVFLGKHRSQMTMSYYLAGAGRKGRIGDETRYMLAPPDPNMDGVAMPLLAMAMVFDPGGSASEDLLGIVLRDPMFSTLISLIGAVPQEGTMDTPIPSEAGVNLLPLVPHGIVITKDKNDNPIKPADPGFDPMTTHYYINGKMNSGLHLVPYLTAAWLAALEVSRAKTNLQGGEGFRSTPDEVDAFGAYSWFVTGNMTKLRNTSPSATALAGKYDALDRVRSLIAEMGGTTVDAPPVNTSTLNWREWTSVAAKDTNWRQTAADTVRRVRESNGRYGDADIAYMRLYLVARGEDPRVVGALDKRTLVRQILKSE